MATPIIEDLGWHNAGGRIGKIIDDCREVCLSLKHQPIDKDLTWPRGIDHEVTCNDCGYKYHYDSSD